MAKLHEPTEEELQAAWKRVEEYWASQNKHGRGMLDYPWTRARFNLEIFKTMLSQRGWKVPHMMGGPLR